MRALLLLLFFASGAVGLVYEVAWTRGLLLLLGSTAGATATVLGVFVAGLGLGARWGGSRAEKSARPLVLYGLLEVLAGLWSLLTLLLLGALITPYVAIAAQVPEALRLVFRIVVAIVIVFPAAFLLGATLPAMVRHWVRTVDRTGRTTAWLYGVNTVGAVVGCVGAGFFGIELLGVSGSLVVAAAAGVVIGGVAMLLGNAERQPRIVAPTSNANLPSSAAAVAALLCGFIGLGVEVAGFRILVFFLEGFTVTFAAMLGMFIAGLGLGSLALGDVLARTARPARVLGVVLLVEACLLLFALLWVVPSLEGLMHDVKADAYAGSSSEAEITAALRYASLVGAAILLFVPAFLLGPTFPLCVRWAEKDGLPPGEAVGRVYVGNSVGSVLAPLLLTFAIMPWVGVLGGWLMVAVLTLLAGAGLVLLPEARLKRRSTVATLTLAALLAGLLAPLPGMPGARTSDLVEASVVLRNRPDRQLVDYATDNVTTASVIETDDGERLLYTDDFAAAATGRYDRYMRMLGHLPALLAKDPKNAMVIAFGTGTTAGAVAAHADVKRLEVVEISQAVLDLAHHFGESNRGVLQDSRVTIVRDDGRNTLLLHKPDLDLITLEPLMPYSPQGLPLYTREFYELARARLRDGGVLCQWVPVHAMRADLYASFVRTFFEVFPQGTLWFFEQASVLIGWKGDARPDAETIDRRVQAIAGDLLDAGFEDPWMFASGYLCHGLDVLGADGPPVAGDSFWRRPVMDGDPFPEFHPTPRANLNTQYLGRTLGWLESLVDPASEPREAPWWPERLHGRRDGTRRALEARRYGAEAHYTSVFVASETLSVEQRRALVPKMLDLYDQAANTFGKALELIPSNRVLRRRRLLNLRLATMVRAAALMRRADRVPEGEARTLLRQADRLMRAVLPPTEDDPAPFATERERTTQLHATIQLRLGRCTKAEATLRRGATDLGGLVAGRRLARHAQALAALVDGRPGAAPGWMRAAVERGDPCRESGVDAIEPEIQGFRRALSSGSDERMHAALVALARAAAREDLIEELARTLEPEAGADAAPGMRLLLAALRLAASPRDVGTPRDPLLQLVGEGTAPLTRAVLEHVERRSLIDRYAATSLVALGGSKDPAIRRAYVAACGKASASVFVCHLVAALMDPDPDVRKEAVGILFPRASEELTDYDPEASAGERRPAYEAVRRKLGC